MHLLKYVENLTLYFTLEQVEIFRPSFVFRASASVF